MSEWRLSPCALPFGMATASAAEFILAVAPLKAK
jgi:hypothetical protein